MQRKSVHRSFVIVDIERYGRRANEDQRWLRQQMYQVVRAALQDAGIDWDTCVPHDRGDSIILLVPPDVSKTDLTDTFVERLDRQLAAYARRAAAPVRMRMRLALHAGEVSQDEYGWVGTDLNTACRLADLQAARDALTETEDANLVVVVSDPWFKSVVSQDPVLVEHFAFREISFQAKEVDDRAWLHIRGRAAAEPKQPVKPPPAKEKPAPAGHVFHISAHQTGDIVGTQFNHGTDTDGR
jgi:hypothetical protein